MEYISNHWLALVSMGAFAFLSAMMIIVILLQRGRGGGLAGALGGAGGQSAFGNKAGDLFTWITVYMAAAWILMAIATTFAMRPSSKFKNPEADSGTAIPKAGAGVSPLGGNMGLDKDQEAAFPSGGDTQPADPTQPADGTQPAGEMKPEEGAAASDPATEPAQETEAPAATPDAPKAETPDPEQPAAEAPAPGAAAEGTGAGGDKSP